MVKRAFLLVIASASIGAVACRPNVDETTSHVTSPRFLAVRSEPAEAAPLAPVTLRALFVDATGDLTQAPIDWAFCDDRKPLAELGPVSPRCLQHTGDFFEPIGAGLQVVSAVPQKACRQFGPDVPEAVGDAPPGRPVDPDPTGGYYQPERVLGQSTEGEIAGIGRTRITCTITGATPDQLADLKRKNHPNTNPSLDAVAPFDVTSSAGAASQGQTLTLHATWTACAADAVTCTGSEHYASFDTSTQSVLSRTEAVRLSWFSTDGNFDADHTGREEGDAVSSSDNTWTAPNHACLVHIWVVIRDDRGGVGWRSFGVDVK